MATNPRQPYRRRNFFIKQWFQVRFALYPIGFLATFLLASGLYLRVHLRDTLEFHLYMPHSQLQNPWEVVAPALVRVTVWGGAAFLLALGVWVWRRYARLNRDFEALAGWTSRLGREAAGVEPLPGLHDKEILALGTALHRSAAEFASWDQRVDERRRVLAQAVSALKGTDGEALVQGLKEARAAWDSLQGEVAAMRVEEDLA